MTISIKGRDNEIPVNFGTALEERYLAYAISTIVSRSLPDVRDGLKPVHRRLLYAMRQLYLNPNSSYKKSARVVGDVMGKFHPHGDAAIYEAMVRLAQDFAQRYPLVDGQGNFGNIDGDNAAAMRYTEARLTTVAAALLEGIDENAVDFRSTYDGEGSEPVVLPARFPNLLANGSQGIAVGMATNIPPHNIIELCQALSHIIHNPNATTKELIQFIKGPDFPTGGLLVENKESIIQTYNTGKGSFRIRARWTVEKIKGGSWQIVVNEIPYQVQKAKLIQQIAELLENKKIPVISDLRDESSTDLRLIIEPKNRAVNPEVVMETLFRQTDLEIRFNLNMNVLDLSNTPQVMSLSQVLKAFLTHQRDVLLRRTTYHLNETNNRIEILEGYLIAYLNLDEVIRVIRHEDNPKQIMIKKWHINDVQADAILNMKLKALQKLEEITIKKEHQSLQQKQKKFIELLKSENKQWKKIDEDLQEIKEAFTLNSLLSKRRTTIVKPESIPDISLEQTIEKEPVTILCSEKGWIKTIKGHSNDINDIKYKEGDKERFVIEGETTDKLITFATNGRFYSLNVDKLPGGRGFGEPIRLMLDIPNNHDLLMMSIFKNQEYIIIASDGRGFIVESQDILAQTRNGKQILNLSSNTEAQLCIPISGDHLALIGNNKKMLIIPTTDIPKLSRGRGVILQKYKENTEQLITAKFFNIKDGLSWTTNGKNYTEKKLDMWLGKRGQTGRLVPKYFPHNNKF
ncbi:MAG: DNA topoisomerase IV subunit A [Alphaproteobacteria bacterium]|nr:DNA topoisomerase IV subunit A [Alphaproteobacteria bacterium]